MTMYAVVESEEKIFQGRRDECLEWLENHVDILEDLDLVIVKEDGSLGRCVSFVLC